MARLFLRNTALDDFTTLAAGEKLETDSAHWAVLSTAFGNAFKEDAALDKVHHWFCGSGGSQIAYYNKYSPGSADYGVLIRYAGTASTGPAQGLGAVARASGPGASYSDYMGSWRCEGGAWLVRVLRTNGGVETLLCSQSISAPSVGDTLRLEARTNGSQVDLAVYLNESDAAVLTYSDTSGSRITVAGHGGAYGFCTGGGSQPKVSQWKLFEVQARHAVLAGPLAGCGQMRGGMAA